MNSVFALLVLTLALYLPPAAQAGGIGDLPTQKSFWSASFSWLKSCCPPNIFKCRPEPKHCQPDCVCADCLCRCEPEHCQPECVCPPCLCREEPKYCEPECVCCDPEPHCRDDCRADGGKGVMPWK